jgi:hypothetical protein
MALLDDLRLNEGVDADELEKRMQGGGIPPEGMHHAYLDGYRECTANTGTKGHEMTFKILGGPAAGMVVKETVWAPKGEDEEKDKKARDKLRLYGHRLGLLKKVTTNGKSTYVAAEGKSDFIHCMGAEVIIDVMHEDDEYTNKQGKAVKAKKARLTYEGVIGLDDKRAATVKRGAKPTAGAIAASAASAATAAAKQPTQQQFAGI